LACDRGGQFDCPEFREWCRLRGIKPRYGAVNKHGSVAVVERLIQTMKLVLSLLLFIPLCRRAFCREVEAAIRWYNEFRPHTTLGGRTPDEAYNGTYPANRRPRFEPRAHWPRGSPCARPCVLVKGKPGVLLELDIEFLDDRRHLPIVRVKRAA
jgi:hypothetical protein